MSKLYKSVVFAGSSLIIMGLSGTSVDAQTLADPEVSSNDIVVTARRSEERLQDVPISITVFNQQQLTSRNVVSSGDLATYTPSLTANGRFGAENTSFAIRGFVQDQGTAPSVAVYFADVAALRTAGGTTLGNGAGPGAFFDLQNVQVLKGSQGTLFGRNTTGGAVLLVPQKPKDSFEGYVEGSIGSDDLRRIQAVLNLPVGESIAVRLGVDRQKKDGYLHNTSGIGPKDFADTDYVAARGSVVINLTPDLENYLIGTYSDSDTNGFLPQVFTCAPGVLALPAGSSAAALAASRAAQGLANLGCNQIARRGSSKYNVENATQAPRQHIQQWQVINTTTWRASDALTIKNIASYGEFRELFRGSPYGDNLILTTGPRVGQNVFRGGQSAPPLGGNSAGTSTFTEELQFQGTGFDNRLNWQVGGYAEISDPIGLTGSTSPSNAVCLTANSLECVSAGVPGITSLVISRLNKQSFRDYGLYGQGTYKLTDQLSFTAGARYTWDRTKALSQQIAYVPLPITTNPAIGRCLAGPLVNTSATSAECETIFTQKASKPTWVFDIDYKPNDDILLYAKYARGYRAGGIKTDGGNAFAVFDPEKVDTYEGGIKTSFRGAVPGTFNVTGFYSDLSNQQLSGRLDPNPAGPLAGSTPAQVVASIGKSRIYGVEIEANVNPFEGFHVDASYAYLNSKLKSVSTLAAGGSLYLTPVTSTTAVGYPLGYTPKNKFSVTANYALPLDGSIGTITLGATFSHGDSQLTTAGYIIPVVGPSATNPNPIVPIDVLGVNYGRIPDINLLNLNVNWNSVLGKPIDVAFFMTNATNNFYTNAVFGGIGAFGFDARAIGDPRQFGFRAKVRF